MSTTRASRSRTSRSKSRTVLTRLILNWADLEPKTEQAAAAAAATAAATVAAPVAAPGPAKAATGDMGMSSDDDSSDEEEEEEDEEVDSSDDDSSDDSSTTTARPRALPPRARRPHGSRRSRGGSRGGSGSGSVRGLRRRSGMAWLSCTLLLRASDTGMPKSINLNCHGNVFAVADLSCGPLPMTKRRTATGAGGLGV